MLTSAHTSGRKSTIITLHPADRSDSLPAKVSSWGKPCRELEAAIS
jgi:hypothetical protein